MLSAREDKVVVVVVVVPRGASAEAAVCVDANADGGVQEDGSELCVSLRRDR